MPGQVDVTERGIYVRVNPDPDGVSNRHAVTAVQAVTDGSGSALYAEGHSTIGPAVKVRGAGRLAQFEKADGTVVATLSNTGVLDVAEVTVAGGSAAGGGFFAPSDHGLIAWNFTPYAATSSALAPTGGTIYAMKIKVPVATTITNVIIGINVQGSTLTTGQNFAALYSGAKALLSATADQTSTWGSTTGPITMALSTPQPVPAGYVYVAFLSNGTTPPTLNRGAGNINNVGLSSATALYATAGTSQTSMPSTITTTAYTSASIWAAVS